MKSGFCGTMDITQLAAKKAWGDNILVHLLHYQEEATYYLPHDRNVKSKEQLNILSKIENV